MASKKQKKQSVKPGVVFVGFMFLGIGIGMIFGNAGAGTLIGLGIGFLAMFHLNR